jgi:prolyl 4-hydroxylase
MELVLKTKWLYVMDNVLTDQECDELINESEESMYKSGTVGVERKNYRTSFNTFLSKTRDLDSIKETNLITQTLTDTDIETHESLCIIRYEEGQEYKAHHDYFCKETMSEELKRGGDRIFTLLFFLNDGFEGGGTIFTKLGLEIRPKKGRLILWRNYLDGEQNVMSKHAGMPVLKGKKYVAVKWIRENKFE